MTGRTIGIGIVVVVIAFAGGYAFDHLTRQPAAPTKTPTVDTSGVASQPIVRFNGTTFSPATYTVKAGSKIVFLNTSSMPLSIYSDPHPGHTNNPELNAGEVPVGTSKTVTLTKTGDWGYHNETNPGETGRLTVQ